MNPNEAARQWLLARGAPIADAYQCALLADYAEYIKSASMDDDSSATALEMACPECSKAVCEHCGESFPRDAMKDDVCISCAEILWTDGSEGLGPIGGRGK